MRGWGVGHWSGGVPGSQLLSSKQASSSNQWQRNTDGALCLVGSQHVVRHGRLRDRGCNQNHLISQTIETNITAISVRTWKGRQGAEDWRSSKWYELMKMIPLALFSACLPPWNGPSNCFLGPRHLGGLTLGEGKIFQI